MARLDSEQVVQTLERLKARVGARFPGSGLEGVATGLAALYAARTQDPQIVAAVNDVEGLCTDLGRKIWQKITILSALDERAAGR